MRPAKKIFPSEPILPIVTVLIALLASPAAAAGLQEGYWKVTSRPEVNGQLAPPQEKMRCLTPAEVSDLDTTFSPEARTINSACERVEHEATPVKIVGERVGDCP